MGINCVNNYNIGVFTANTFEVKRIDIDFFESEE